MGFPDYDSSQWGILGVCAVLAGVAKTGVPGLGILNVPLMAAFFPAKASTGALLPILALADIFAVFYYRRHAQWRFVIRLLPWSLTGIFLGTIVIRFMDDRQLKPIIGVIVAIMLAISWWRDRKPEKNLKIPDGVIFAAAMGVIAGLTTQLANAAGPIMVIYLLAMRLPKEAFIGTGAWYFLILNWLKVPLFVSDGRISGASFLADLTVLPLIGVGAVLGIVVLKKLPQRQFNALARLLAAVAAVKLIAAFADWA